jgi:hypothetical protein
MNDSYSIGTDILDIGSRRAAERRQLEYARQQLAAELRGGVTHFEVPNVENVRCHKHICT